MKVYLAGSMSGGREFADGLLAINSVLQEFGHEVLTPFVVDERISATRFPGLQGQDEARAVFEDDLRLLQQADVAIAEISQPSTGVGVEIGFLVGLARLSGAEKPTLFLRHQSLEGTRNSKMVEGNVHGSLVYYKPHNVHEILTEFFKDLGQEGKVNKERE